MRARINKKKYCLANVALDFYVFKVNNNSENIILEQNNPNPFSEITVINYYIPSKYKGNAILLITDESGIQVFSKYDICIGKPCQLTVSAKDLTTGVYIYGIELDGTLVKSKKMMIIK